MQPRDKPRKHRGTTGNKDRGGECFADVNRDLGQTQSAKDDNRIRNGCTFSRQSSMVSATLLSSTSPPSKSTSEPLSRIHPGTMRVPRPVPVCCETGGVTFKRRSVAVEWRIYKFASACSWCSPALGRPGRTCDRDTTEKSDEARPVLLSRSAETREKSDSEGAPSLGGKSRSIGSSPNGDTTPDSDEVSIASPTKEHRVLISSRTASERTSNGTRVEREEAGMLTAALRDVGGGR